MGTINVNYIKIIKISIGCCAAIFLASLLELQNSASAGVITLLSIQNTKKETLLVAVRRIIAFIFAYFIAFGAFSLFGFKVSSFGLFLFIFLIVCCFANLEEGIAMNTVLITHFLVAESMDIYITLNELMILGIGITIGIIINLYMPRKIELIKKDQITIDKGMIKLLEELSAILVGKQKDSLETMLFSLEDYAQQALSRAYENMNNTLISDMRYYVQYMEMRIAQCAILRKIHKDTCTIPMIPSQAYIISEFLQKTADSFHEYNNAVSLLEDLEEMRSLFESSSLPVTRKEFETRAILFQTVNDIEFLLLVKKKFADSLSEWQIQYFWKE